MSTSKGTPFETACVKVAVEAGWPDATRIPKTGAKDKGDLDVVPGYALECKNEQRINLAGAMDEATVEAANAGKPHAAAIVKRRGKHARQAYVVQELGPWLEREREIADMQAYVARLEATLAITDAVLDTIGVVCRASGETLEVSFEETV